MLYGNEQFAEIKRRIDVKIQLPVSSVLVVQGPLIQFRAVTQLRYRELLPFARRTPLTLNLKQVELPSFDPIGQLSWLQLVGCCFRTEPIKQFNRLTV